MYSALYTIARWTEYVSGAIALISLLTIIVRLSRSPRRPILLPSVALIVTGALCAGMFVFGRGRVEHIRLDSIKQIGLETHHEGLRSNALIYQTQVSIPVTFMVVPSVFPGSGIIDAFSKFIYHKTTTAQAQVAVYGLIDFTTVASRLATVNKQSRTITLALPDPTIGPGTTYIWSVAGVQQREGPLDAVAQSITGPIDSLLGRPVLSVSLGPALARAKAAALKLARSGPELESCSKDEIVQQLTDALNLTPAYRGYLVRVNWPAPPAANVNCARLQQQLASNGG